MAKKFSRHEQFLRIFSLLEILSAAHVALSDDVLLAALRDRLGLSKLSARTLRRDCEFLTSCGYPIDHVPLPQERKLGWKLDTSGPLAKKLLAEPLTLLELVAFQLARAHLKPYEGTPLWSGIEMLRSRFEKCVPEPLKRQLDNHMAAFRVQIDDSKRYASRPRLVSTLAATVVACRPVDLEHEDDDGRLSACCFHPHRLLLERQRIDLFGYDTGNGSAEAKSRAKPMIVPVERIQKVQLRDGRFDPQPTADRDLELVRRR